MCSTVVMPADYEMLLSHSPPVYSHGSQSASFLADYSCAYDSPYSGRSTIKNAFNNRPRAVNVADSGSAPFRRPLQPTSKPLSLSTMPGLPRRPCLVLRPGETHEENPNDPISPTKLKKKVVFADDRGMSLTHVRVMSEPSNVPPLWSLKFLAQVTKGIDAEATPEPWEATFPQPASDYVAFRRRLDEESVSLENVIVRESEQMVVGTVKVRNIAYDKEVIIRCTSDEWKTREDVHCTYVKNAVTPNIGSGVYVLYDTFSFKLMLPPNSRRLQFCVCFRCEGNEYWDNNNGKNYVIIKKTNLSTPVREENIYSSKLVKSNSDTATIRKFSCITQASMDTWSEFASWNNLDNNTPYW